MKDSPRACVVGHGTAGRLHHRFLEKIGFHVGVVDPLGTHGDHRVPCWNSVAQVPPGTTVWSICTPTDTHLDVLAEVLAEDPAARVLLEKPACRADETGRLRALLARHPQARLIVMDQYRHCKVFPLMADLLAEYAPGERLRQVAVAFSKERYPDMRAGRFVDRDHGVFGYEWPHMLTIARQVLGEEVYGRYVGGPVTGVRGTCDPGFFVVTAAESEPLPQGPRLELFSTIVVGDGADQSLFPAWTKDYPYAVGGRQRLVRVEAGPVLLTAELDPLPRGDGPALPRNTHRLTLELEAERHQWLVYDSPLENAVREAVHALLGAAPCPVPDLRPLRRIAALADAFRPAAAPHDRPGAADPVGAPASLS